MRGGVRAWRNAGLPLVPRSIEAITQLADVCPECGSPATEHDTP